MSQSIGRTMLAYHRSWRHINAENQVVGRLATNIAAILMGKHKPIYDPASDCGDNVVVTNSKYLLLTGRKAREKVYYRHSGKPGHLKVTPVPQMIEKKGTGEILKRAVSGMLPKNKLRNARLSRLKIYDGEHAGPFMRNIVRRYDAIPLPTKAPSVQTAKDADAQLETIEEETLTIPSTRTNDTPVLGSLGGRLPKAQFTPKVKPRKIKRRHPAPGMMKIYDSQGRQWGRQKWKETGDRVSLEAQAE